MDPGIASCVGSSRLVIDDIPEKIWITVKISRRWHLFLWGDFNSQTSEMNRRDGSPVRVSHAGKSKGPQPKPPWRVEISWQRRVLEVPAKRDETKEAEEPAQTCDGDQQVPKAPRNEVQLLVITYRVVQLRRSPHERVRFRVNHDRDGRITFTDTRDRSTGIAGVTGRWGTLPPPKPVRSQSMSASAFKQEAARFVGPEKAEEIVRQLTTKPARTAGQPTALRNSKPPR